ncbi:MAG: tRNA pseudouridine synthase A, partial [Nocardioidaceae bacterium]|nr:tRNA pseudouridine synthase A [Nocardioidaceae bacterium]
LRIEYDQARVTCAGRTDAGVHARGQVVHVDLSEETLSAAGVLPDQFVRLQRRLNGVLARDVNVRDMSHAAGGFDARFAALWRRYTYRIVDDPALVDPLARRHVLAWPRMLDQAAMDQAARSLIGLNDFAAFCKHREGATTVRTLLDFSWRREETGLLVASVRADAFCHSMVRALVGCSIAVGEGRKPPEWAAEIMTGRRRDPAVVVVPARGLCLEEVAYPADVDLAARVQQTAARREPLEDG